MDKININSSDIRIFPISFDRSKGSKYLIWARNATQPSENASDQLKNYLSNNQYIIGSLPSIDGINAYYDQSLSGTELQQSYYNGRILSEGNISKLISALTDTEKFVIEYNAGAIEFVIRGHYFKAILPEALRTTCYIGVNFKDDYEVYETLDAYDTAIELSDVLSDVLINVDFSEDELIDRSKEGDYDVVLHLLENGKVPTDSYFKFTSRSISKINGGTV